MDYQDDQNQGANPAVELDDYKPRVKKDERGFAEITLSDGRVAKYIRKPKGRDAALARDNSGRKDNDLRRLADLLSRLILIDGEKVNPDQVLDLDLDDLNLVGENLPGNF